MKKMSLFFAAGVAVGATLLTGCSKEVMDQRLYKDDADAKKGEIVAAALDGKLLSAEEAKALATIPS